MHMANPQGGVLRGQPILDELGIMGFPVAPSSAPGIPSLSISDFTSPYQLPQNDYIDQTIQAIDQLTYQHGNHTIKGGFEYRPQQGTGYFNPSFGTFNFNGNQTGFAYADFLLGLPQTTGYTYTRPPQYGRQYFLNGFLQDDWKITPNLMLSYGIRYDYNSAPVDKENIISSFNPATGAIVVPSLTAAQEFITPGFPSQIPIQSAHDAGFPTRSLRNAFKYAIYPRLGFAYSIGKNTVLRGGYGIYNNDLTIDTLDYLYQAPYGGTVGYTNSITNGVPAITFTQPTNASTGSLGAFSMFTYPTDLRNPYVQQWNLTVEQNIGFYTSLRLSYIGSKANALLYGKDINQVHASTTPFSQANTPYPLFQHVYEESNGAIQKYNAFTAEVDHHMRKNLLFEGALTWAKNLNVSTGSSSDDNLGVIIEDAYNLPRQLGNDQYTPRLQFVSNLIWTLPVGPGQMLLSEDNLWTKLLGGWQLSGAFLANTGQYLTPTFSGPDASNTNHFSGTADRVGKPSPIGGRSINNWFNPKAYAIPQNGKFGNAGFGSLEGPGSQVLNLALFKSFPLPRQSTIQVEGSFTNVLNHPNFGNPNTTVTDTSAGKITTVQGRIFGPRSGLLSVRYTF